MEQKDRSFILLFSYLPRFYRIILGSLIIITLALIVWRPYIDCSMVMEQSYSRATLLNDYHLDDFIHGVSKPLDQKTLDSDGNILKDEPYEYAKEKIGIYEYIISSGDILNNIFTQYDINISDINTLAQENSTLRNLKIGQSLSRIMTTTGHLQYLTWGIAHCQMRTYGRINSSFRESTTNMIGKWRNTTLTGKLEGSFVTSARAAGLTNSDINAVIKALQWQLDFRKLHKGDQFSVLTSREIFNGKNAKSQLLGVRFQSSGKDYYAFRANNGKFYNRDAAELTRGFMRFPVLKKFRVSSSFNLNRLNPITGRIAPHRGVDFAVPVGTPVLAVGDGEVMVSKRDNIAGNYVAIRHDRQYITRYMHLKKLLVKPQQKVKRGDRIALSGNTGRSTGPHLHYEVWVNHQAVNPLTAKLPHTESLTGYNRSEYLDHVKQILLQLQIN